MEPLESFEGISKGDILVSLTDNGTTSRLNGTITKVHFISNSNSNRRISYKGIGGTECHSYHPKQFRKATPEEVEAYHAGVTNIGAISKNAELKYTYGDNVTFKVGDITLEYKVCYEHLSTSEVNDKIFKLLGLDPHEFCKEHYGYEPPISSWWPTAKDGDYAALNRVIEALQKECDKFNAKNAEPVSPSPKFKVGDKVKVLSYGSQGSGMLGKICTISRVKINSDRSCWYELEEDLIKFLWEEHRLEAVAEEPTKFESVQARLGYIRDSMGITTPEGIFRELFGFNMPEYGREIIFNGLIKTFNDDAFKDGFLNRFSGWYGHPDYLITLYWGEDSRQLIREAIRKCQPSIQLANGAASLKNEEAMTTNADATTTVTKEYPVTSGQAHNVTVNPAYPYRIKTWEELLATPGCHLDIVGSITGPDDAFTVSMKQYCGMPLSTSTPQSIPGAYFWLRTWMITENTPTNQSSKSAIDLKLKSSNSKNTIDSTVYKVPLVQTSLRKASKSKFLK